MTMIIEYTTGSRSGTRAEVAQDIGAWLVRRRMATWVAQVPITSPTSSAPTQDSASPEAVKVRRKPGPKPGYKRPSRTQ